MKKIRQIRICGGEEMKVRLGEFIQEFSVRNRAEEDIPVYSVTNSEGFCTGYFDKDVASNDRSTYKIVPRGCFAYNPSRINVGSVDWQRYEDKVIVSPLYVVFSVSDRLDPQYLYFFLKSNVALTYIRAAATGSVRDNLRFSMLQEFSIELRTIEEQLKVTQTLDRVQTLIKLYKRQLHTLDILIKARFVEMFGDPVSNPKQWKMIELGQLTSVGSSKRIFEKEYVAEGVPFYRTKEIVELSKGNQISTELFISRERFDEIKQQYGVPQIGDLLISAVGTIGVIWIVDGKNDFYFKDGNLIRVDRSDKYNSVYMKTVLENLISEYKKQMSAGTAYAALTISGVSNMKVYDVPLAFQNEFAAFVSQVDKSKVVVQKALDEAQLLYDSLMQKYFG